MTENSGVFTRRNRLSNGDVDRAYECARICHEVNRVYSESIGESKPTWKDAPEHVRESAIAGVQTRMQNPHATPKEMHQSWMNYKLSEGWTHGPTLDYEKMTHPNIVAYYDLPKSQRVKDELFLAVCRAFLGD